MCYKTNDKAVVYKHYTQVSFVWEQIVNKQK